MENIFNRNRSISTGLSNLIKEPKTVQELVNAYISDPGGLMPAQWIVGEALSSEEKRSFMQLAHAQAPWLNHFGK